MNPVIAWFARHGVAANLLMILILVGGSLTLPGIKEEIFPELPTNLILVSVEYLGASPEEVEEAVCMRVEEAILGITGIKRLRSTAREGVGAVFVEVLTGADSRQVLDEVKARVDAIDTFPEETERPQVQEHLFRRQVINVAVSGDTDERSLRVVAEQVRDELSRLPEISLVQLANARPYEISVEVPEEALRRYGLTFDHVARAVRSSSLDLPGGSVKTRGGEILVRTKGQAYRGREFEDIILISRNDGSRLRLGDVARVIDGFADTDQIVRFGGKPAILVQVFRVGQQGALAIADAVRDYISEAQRRLPEGITLTAWQDDSKVLRSRLDLMLRNGRVGLILVFASLALFLRLKLSFWVALGIPISFLGAVWILPLLGVSLNLISLFAFIVALGIVVDDAIIIGENVYTHIQQGGSGVDAATAGAQEMSTPVIFAILTTVAAFSPLVLVPGRYGEIMRVIPLVVIATLAFSLIESLLILPHHLAHFKSPDEERPGPVARGWRAFQGLFTGLLDRFIRRVYRPFLDGAIRWRYVTVTTGVGLLLLTGGMVFAGWIKFTFFPQVDADNVVAFLTMPQGAPLEVTERAVRKIEKAAEELRAEINREGVSEIDDIYLHSLTSIGGQPFREAQNQNRGQLASFSGGHLAEINIELIPSEERSISSADVANRWRRKVGSVADAVELTFSSSIFASGDDVNVQLSSPHLDDLRQAAAELKRHLATYTGVHDIADSFRAGKQELKLSIKPAAENLGLTLADLARQVRQGFYGEEAQRIQRERDDLKVMVRYPESERRSLGDVENMRIRTPDGAEVPFTTVAEAHLGRGFSTIERTDRQRIIRVTATVDPQLANANEVNADLREDFLPRLVAAHPRLSFGFEGEQRDQAETIESLRGGFVLALFLIYALLAIPFRSYVQPLIVMTAIPFGVAGAVWGHMLMGKDLTLLSLFGVVALTGVIVNDSLVMVDFINRKRRAGQELLAAVKEAGAARFRPIFLTSLTTFAGLSPILFEKSLQAQFLIPMAISLGFGVAFGTLVTLVIVPVVYYILDDVRHLWHWLWSPRPLPRTLSGTREEARAERSGAREQPTLASEVDPQRHPGS